MRVQGCKGTRVGVRVQGCKGYKGTRGARLQGHKSMRDVRGCESVQGVRATW